VREHRFFYSAKIRSVAYEDVFNVTTAYSLLFGTLELSDKFFVQQPIIIRHLWKNDARKTRRIIQGIIIAKKEGINMNKIPLDLLIHKVEELGKTAGG